MPRARRRAGEPAGSASALQRLRPRGRRGRRSCGCGGVEEPDPGGELGWDVDDLFAVLEEPLGQRSACAVASLDCPDPLRPAVDVLAHRGVAGAIGGEPPRSKSLFVLVDDLDRGRQLVGIDPDDDALRMLPHVLLPPVLDPMWTARWALLLRAGQSLLEPRLVTVTGGLQTDSEPHQISRWAAAWRASRRSPGPSLARRRSFGNRLVAASYRAARMPQLGPSTARCGLHCV